MSTSDESPLESEGEHGLDTVGRRKLRRIRAEATHRAEVEPFAERTRTIRPSWGVLVFFAILTGMVGWSIGFAGAGLGWW